MSQTKQHNAAPDPHTFAQPQSAVVTHLDLDITVNFETKTISGCAIYTLAANLGVTEIVFDTNGLHIEQVQLNDRTKTAYHLGEEKPFLGRPLIITIKPNTHQVFIWYSTTHTAAALQWLTPEQTSGKKYPFLFSQSQAILARTWLPCQDSPGIRFTYRARVQVPPTYLALMSAENPQQKNSTGLYTFTQNRPIPAYLMALAVGDLKFKALDERTGIYAEPDQLEVAYQEFTQLPTMLAAAENLYGNYLWGRYDLLLLPPSFPFGGMENPMLTFVTPTIIAGDQSLTSLVAHELAHSWSGNLVTNATWNDFWLNEGFTVYFERRIMEAILGKDYADMLKVLGYQDLQNTLAELGPESADTCLKLNLENRDPDEGLTEIAYEKGNYFLLALEEQVGRAAFDDFIRNYFQEHAFQAMNTEYFISYLQEKLLLQPNFSNEQVQPEAWIYKPSLPDNGPKLNSKLFASVQEQANLWQQNIPAKELPAQNWSTQEWLYFLHLIGPDLNAAKMQELDQEFNLTNSGNSEILAVWLEYGIKNKYEAINITLKQFLERVGRRKFLVPLYKQLIQQNAETAKQIYRQARPNYHAVATSTLDVLMDNIN